MRYNILRAAAVFAMLAAPVAAHAYPGDNWNYATDSWPQIEASLQSGRLMNFAEGKSSVMSDASFATPHQSAAAMRDETGIVHYGSTNGAFWAATASTELLQMSQPPLEAGSPLFGTHRLAPASPGGKDVIKKL